jgi:hypothetical protein
MKRDHDNRPTHAVYSVVEGEGKKEFWTKIGAAWKHENGDGMSISLDAIPLHGRLVVRKPKVASEATPAH